jgi:hypothetical protein
MDRSTDSVNYTARVRGLTCWKASALFDLDVNAFIDGPLALVIRDPYFADL